MLTGALHILQTHNTPEVVINPAGTIMIKGRALMVDNTEIPDQMMDVFEAYLRNPPETTDVIIALEYLNSFSATILVSVFEKISQAIQLPKKLVIRWYYEEDDEDMLELGKYISEICVVPIEFTVTNDITDI
jgi:SiaC family regulatory phosphoprotein